MAHLRLLMAAAVSMGALVLAGCGPVFSGRIAGQVVDKATGEPVSGAEVFCGYGVHNRTPLHSLSGGIDGQRWTTTDAEGRFEFPSYVVTWYRSYILWESTGLKCSVLHRDYGMRSGHTSRKDQTALRFEIEPHERYLKYLSKPSRENLGGLCMVTRPALRRCCVVAYGDIPLCEEKNL